MFSLIKGNSFNINEFALSGKVNKSDLFGNSTLHYAVRGKCLSCVSFLINYEPKLILKMDNNLQNAIELAKILQYNEVFILLSTFSRKYFTMKLSEVFKIQLKEIENVRKRRRRNEQKLRKNEKSFSNNEFDVSKKKAFKSSSSSYSLCKQTSNSRIVVDENVTLCNLKPIEGLKIRENIEIRDCSNRNVSIATTQLLNMSANQVSFA
jgi:hypothetical protein